MRINELRPVFCDSVPEDIEPGVLYISMKYGGCTHLCACGCGGKTYLRLGGDGWSLENNNGAVTLRPSIGNWSGENPHHAHYLITQNKIQWL